MFKKIVLVMIVSLFVFTLSEFSFAMSCGDHSGSKELAQDHSEQVSGTAGVSPTVALKAMNVGNKICPVSGEKVGQSGMEPVTYEYESKVYNFCCASCVDEFKKDPEKYIKKVAEELQAASRGE